ncbi:MAG: transporter [Acidobacteria bacterium RIFCSPLOWO2_02_FULL_60_20]|nr:MAG: transporter [Acidobacteria bacterium RIFCSPLOWO2_02_FULL_60_20]
MGLLNDLAKDRVLAVQEFTLMSARAVRNIFRRPHYMVDVVRQMDFIGFGSLPIVILTGFFTGAVLALQMSKTLMTFGETSLTGQLVMLSLVRELGPVLTSLMVAGRNSSGIASELGSMMVSEQIDAMRALGTDPSKKLVTPRLVATVIMLPMLTIVADSMGMLGGFATSFFMIHMNPAQYWTSALHALEFEDVFQGLIKPFVFAFIVSLVGCYYGLTTRGGTAGVGRSTTQAVVAASVMILVSDFFITKIILAVLD